MKAAGPKSASASAALEKLLALQRLQALGCRYAGRKPTYHSHRIEDFLRRELDASSSSFTSGPEFHIGHRMPRQSFAKLRARF
mgnify:CR=1 FL=1